MNERGSRRIALVKHPRFSRGVFLLRPAAEASLGKVFRAFPTARERTIVYGSEKNYESILQLGTIVQGGYA
jgi:hypothetical protein